MKPSFLTQVTFRVIQFDTTSNSFSIFEFRHVEFYRGAFSFAYPLLPSHKVWAHFVHTHRVINNFSLLLETGIIISISKELFQGPSYPSEMAEYNNVVGLLPIRQFPSRRVEIQEPILLKQRSCPLSRTWSPWLLRLEGSNIN